MPLYMYQVAYTAESMAAQMKKPQDRIKTVAKTAAESIGGKLINGWYCFGDYDLILVLELPDNEAMTAIAVAVAAGGAVKAAKTTVLMSGAEAVAGMKKASDVGKIYKPAK